MKKVRILIIDDLASYANSLKMLLEKINKNYSVDHVLTADTALNTLNIGDYNLIITDVQMPGTNGLDFCIQVRASGYTMPIIVLSMYNDLEIAKKVLEVGANKFLNRSMSSSEIKECIEECLSLNN